MGNQDDDAGWSSHRLKVRASRCLSIKYTVPGTLDRDIRVMSDAALADAMGNAGDDDAGKWPSPQGESEPMSVN